MKALKLSVDIFFAFNICFKTKSNSVWKWIGIPMCLFCCFCFDANTTKRNMLEMRVITIPEVISVRCLMEALFEYTKCWWHINKLASDFDLPAVIAWKKLIWRSLKELSRQILCKLYVVRWAIIIGTALSCTSSTLFQDEYDKLFLSTIPKKISLILSLLY